MAEADSLSARVARRIRELRTARGMTQTEAAALARMATNNWQRIEASKLNLTLSTLERVARALAVEPADLLKDAKRKKG